MTNRTDDEQVEELKRWWRENGSSVIAGVVIALVGLFAWQQWQAYQKRTAEAASAEYVTFLEQYQDEEGRAGAVARGEALIDEYGSTPYAALTGLWLASYQVEQKDYAAAAQRLEWVVSHADGEALAAVARLRLARVLLAAGKYDEALARTQPEVPGFMTQFREVRGDIEAARGNTEAATTAYRAALGAAEDPGLRGVIELKLNDLGASAEPAS